MILDFWHASEHLTELAQALQGDDEQARKTWTQEHGHRLKHEGGSRAGVPGGDRRKLP